MIILIKTFLAPKKKKKVKAKKKKESEREGIYCKNRGWFTDPWGTKEQSRGLRRGWSWTTVGWGVGF